MPSPRCAAQGEGEKTSQSFGICGLIQQHWGRGEGFFRFSLHDLEFGYDAVLSGFKKKFCCFSLIGRPSFASTFSMSSQIFRFSLSAELCSR